MKHYQYQHELSVLAVHLGFADLSLLAENSRSSVVSYR